MTSWTRLILHLQVAIVLSAAVDACEVCNEHSVIPRVSSLPNALCMCYRLSPTYSIFVLCWFFLTEAPPWTPLGDYRLPYPWFPPNPCCLLQRHWRQDPLTTQDANVVDLGDRQHAADCDGNALFSFWLRLLWTFLCISPLDKSPHPLTIPLYISLSSPVITTTGLVC